MSKLKQSTRTVLVLLGMKCEYTRVYIVALVVVSMRKFLSSKVSPRFFTKIAKMTKHATRAQRIQVQILAKAGHDSEGIAEMTSLSCRQVSFLDLKNKNEK